VTGKASGRIVLMMEAEALVNQVSSHPFGCIINLDASVRPCWLLTKPQTWQDSNHCWDGPASFQALVYHLAWEAWLSHGFRVAGWLQLGLIDSMTL